MSVYRWTFKTFIPNIRWEIYDFFYGIYNIVRWIPVIWHDCDGDWAYLARIMEYKLSRMSNVFKKYGHHDGSEKDAQRMMVCAELLNRLRTESHYTYPPTRHSVQRDYLLDAYYQEYIGKMIGKHLRYWWN